MKMYTPSKPAHAKSCCGIDDFDDARRSAAKLGIPHYVLDFEEVFTRTVVERFAGEYARGRTPNPCVSCNNFVKLGTLVQYADRLNARYVATGHYARIERGEDGVHLYRNPHAKDQAYALAQLAPEQLDRLLLPLGELDKTGTRAHARRLGLPVHDKTESKDVCFVEGGDYRDVLARLRPEINAGGAVVTSGGERVGEHAGIAHYTVGQRAELPAQQRGRALRHAHRRGDQYDRRRPRRRTAFKRADGRRAQPHSARAFCRHDAGASDDSLPLRAGAGVGADWRRRPAALAFRPTAASGHHRANSSRYSIPTAHEVLGAATIASVILSALAQDRQSRVPFLGVGSSTCRALWGGSRLG